MKKIIYSAFYSLLLISYLTSCDKENITSKNDLQSDDQQSVYTKKGILVFKDLDTFEKTTNMISNFDDQQRAEWEDIIGFESQRRIASNIT